MLIYSKELLFSKQKYTLTVVTTPSDAVCKITANGQTVTAKSISLEAGTYISVTVSYSNTTSKTYTLNLNKNTTLTFTRTYTTSSSTSLNTNYSRHGTGSENITVSSSGVASGFTTYGSLRLGVNTPDSSSCTSFKYEIKIKTPSAASSGAPVIIGSWRIISESGSSGMHNTALCMYKASNRLYFVRAGKEILTTSASSLLSLNTIYYVTAGWDGSTYYIAYNQSYFSSTINRVEKSSTANPFTKNDGGNATDIGNTSRGTAISTAVANRPYAGSIYLMDTHVYYNGSKVWDGTVTTTSYNYYFSLLVS